MKNLFSKRLLIFTAAATMLFGSAITANAAQEDLFDADYYAETYADVAEAVGYDADALLQHYLAYGITEGRNANAYFNTLAYRNAYADLDAAFGDDWDAYADHYVAYGISEGRSAVGDVVVPTQDITPIEETTAEETAQTTEETAAAFVAYGVKGTFMEVENDYGYAKNTYGYDYTTATYDYDESGVKLYGEADVYDDGLVAERFSDEFREGYGLEDGDGYEWRCVEIGINFPGQIHLEYDEDTDTEYTAGTIAEHGWRVGICWEDYYDIVGHDASSVWDDDGTCTFTVNWNGQTYTECKIQPADGNGYAGESFFSWEYFVRLPIGYDGLVIGLYDVSDFYDRFGTYDWGDMHIFDIADDNTLFYRLQ